MTAPAPTPVPVRMLASALPDDVHLMHRDATSPYLVLTDGLRILFVIYVGATATQDRGNDVWATAKGTISPLKMIDAVADWVKTNIDKSFACSVLCWMPNGLSVRTVPENVLLGGGRDAAPALLAALQAAPTFEATPKAIKTIMGIAVDSAYHRTPELLSLLMADEIEASRRAALRDAKVIEALDRAETDPQERLIDVMDKTVIATDDNDVAALRQRMAVPKRLMPAPLDHRLDVMAATLFAEAPWMGDAIQALVEDIRSNDDDQHAAFDPVLLLGPSGCGKSWFARRFAALCGLPVGAFDASSATSRGPFVGLDSHWKGAMPSVVVSTIAEHGVANPIIVVDEVDKSDERHSESLLPLLERSTAATFMDPYLLGVVDLSHANWMLTANDASRVPPALRDRCRVLRIDRPERQHLEAFVHRECEAKGLDDSVADVVVQGLRGTNGLSLRGVQRAVKAAKRTMTRPMLH